MTADVKRTRRLQLNTFLLPTPNIWPIYEFVTSDSPRTIFFQIYYFFLLKKIVLLFHFQILINEELKIRQSCSNERRGAYYLSYRKNAMMKRSAWWKSITEFVIYLQLQTIHIFNEIS